MNCPVCQDIKLVITERQGIEIDYCPKCRGIWLDRGELDKIIERSYTAFNQNHINEKKSFYPDQDLEDYYKRKKRKSFLDELFDF